MLTRHKSATTRIATMLVTALAFAPNTALAAYQNCVPTQILAPETNIQATPQNEPTCRTGGVIRLSDGSSVWRCATGSGSTLASAKIVMLVSANGSIKTLPDDTSRAGLLRFSVWLIDLDNDGTQERILSYWNGVGDDDLANSWTSLVFRADWANLTPPGENDSRNMAGASDIHDWGLSNLIKNPSAPDQCLLAISEFKKVNSVNGLKVDFFELGANSLVASKSLPPVFRPLNRRFKAERRRTLRTLPFSGDVTRWISSSDTQMLPMP